MLKGCVVRIYYRLGYRLRRYPLHLPMAASGQSQDPLPLGWERGSGLNDGAKSGARANTMARVRDGSEARVVAKPRPGPGIL